MFRDVPEREPNPEALKAAAIFSGAAWGFIISLYGVYQLVLVVVSLIIKNGLAYYTTGALAVAVFGVVEHFIYRSNVRIFGLSELVIGMAIGGHIFHSTFSGTNIGLLGVVNILAQLVGSIFLFVRGCRDITSVANNEAH